MNKQYPQLAVIGGGNIASSIIGGLIGSGWRAEHIKVSDPSAAQRSKLAKCYGIDCVPENRLCIAGAAVVVLAVKPQQLRQAVASIAQPVRHNKPLIISIAAGIRSADILAWLNANIAFVRVMPNTPAVVNQGVSGLFANRLCSPQQRQLAASIMQAVGAIIWVDDEALIDTVTAVSGSGPAYFFKLMELMMQAAIANGMDAAAARTLVVETALGAATLMRQSDLAPAELRRQVTSPAGATEAAITTMQKCGIDTAIISGVNAAILRSAELSAEFGGAN